MRVGNSSLYPDAVVPPEETTEAFLTRFCMWATASGFDTPEYLLPVINRKTVIEPFRFEQRFAKSGAASPPAAEITALGPWDYHIEWPDVHTRFFRVALDWTVHRYRSSLLVDLAAEIAGPDRAQMSVLDVASHCGILSLEFAEAGFGKVTGLDLRPRNIEQANYLKTVFDSPNTSFTVENARNLKGHTADVVFCGGLLYHVTFPVELLADLFDATGKFLIFESLCQKHPFSGFHIVGGRDIGRSLEGDNPIELMPTYRAIIDLLRAAGFETIYEILGDAADDVPFYKDRHIRSFVAAKPGFTIPDSVISAGSAPSPASAG